MIGDPSSPRHAASAMEVRERRVAFTRGYPEALQSYGSPSFYLTPISIHAPLHGAG